MARLKLREMITSDVKRNFLCELSPNTLANAEKAVIEAKKCWGVTNLTNSEADDRLSVVCEKVYTDDTTIMQLRAAFQAMESEYKKETEREKAEVIFLGGLHVIGTERHESRRVDNQLRGRAGRQGDPGSTRFFLSLDDNLFRVFGGDKLKNMMSKFQIEELPLETQMLSKSLDEAQRKVENYFFEIRKKLFEYDQVLNTQRDRVYKERKLALLATDLTTKIEEYAKKTMDDILDANIGPIKDKPVEDWPLDQLAEKIREYCYLMEDLTGVKLKECCKGSYPLETLRSYLHHRSLEAYHKKRDIVNKIDPGLMLQAERYFLLMHIDNLWKDHLQAIKFLQKAVGLRGFAQRDPLTEYKLEGYDLFIEMLMQIRRNVIYNIYSFQPTLATSSKVDLSKQEMSNKVLEE